MSVVFQNMDFGMDNDNSEYLFVNDFGNLDDLTLERFMQGVAEPIRTSPVYDVSDDDTIHHHCHPTATDLPTNINSPTVPSHRTNHIQAPTIDTNSNSMSNADNKPTN